MPPIRAILARMAFGEIVRPAESASVANWLEEACQGAAWTVGGLVPSHYQSLLRVWAPDGDLDDWWSAYRTLFGDIALIGQRHTARPDRVWFAIWEGHGFDVAGLSHVPRFDRPDRSYYLLEGPLTAVTSLRYPENHGWRNPDLFWPDDRSWFVATDVDFWSVYVGGSTDFVEELAGSVPCEPVGWDRPLNRED